MAVNFSGYVTMPSKKETVCVFFACPADAPPKKAGQPALEIFRNI
jgi:hypothetical protein